jgi:predicted RND superfamily exporter protein
VTSALLGITIAVSVALVVLVVSTNSVPVGLFATLTIGGIVLTVLATMVGLGWELGTTESVSSVILIGFSVDYTVHIANAYQEAGDFHHDGRPKTRLERVRSAIAEYGVSIVAGGMTTLLAGFPLFMGTIAFFSRFATLICTSIAASLIWSLTFLPAMLMLFGPEDSLCTLSALFQCRLRPKRGSGVVTGKPAAAAIQGAESTANPAVAPASAFKTASPAKAESRTREDSTAEVVKPAGSTPVEPIEE